MSGAEKVAEKIAEKIGRRPTETGCDLSDLRRCETSPLTDPPVIPLEAVLQGIPASSRYELKDGKVVPIPPTRPQRSPLYEPALEIYRVFHRIRDAKSPAVERFRERFGPFRESLERADKNLSHTDIETTIRLGMEAQLLEDYVALLENAEELLAGLPEEIHQNPVFQEIEREDATRGLEIQQMVETLTWEVFGPHTIVWGRMPIDSRFRPPLPDSYESVQERTGLLAAGSLVLERFVTELEKAGRENDPQFQARRRIMESAQRITVVGRIVKRLELGRGEGEGKVPSPELDQMRSAVEGELARLIERAQRELPEGLRDDVIRKARERLQALEMIIVYGNEMDKTSYGVVVLKQAAEALVDYEGYLLRHSLVRDRESLIPSENDPDRPVLEGRLDYLTREINRDETDKVVAITAEILEETDRLALGHAIDDEIRVLSTALPTVRKAHRDSVVSGLSVLHPKYYEDGLKYAREAKRLYGQGRIDEARELLSDFTTSRFHRDLIGHLEVAEAWDASKTLARTVAIVAVSGQVSALVGLAGRVLSTTALGRVGVSLGVATAFWGAEKGLSATAGDPFFERAGTADRALEVGTGIASTWGMFAAIGGAARATKWLTQVARMSPEGQKLAMFVGEYIGFTGWEMVEGNARLAIEEFRFEPGRVTDAVLSWEACRHRAVFLGALKLGNHLASPVINPVARRIQGRVTRSLLARLDAHEKKRDKILKALELVDLGEETELEPAGKTATNAQWLEPTFRELVRLQRERVAILRLLGVPPEVLRTEEQALRNAEQFSGRVRSIPDTRRRNTGWAGAAFDRPRPVRMAMRPGPNRRRGGAATTVGGRSRLADL